MRYGSYFKLTEERAGNKKGGGLSPSDGKKRVRSSEKEKEKNDMAVRRRGQAEANSPQAYDGGRAALSLKQGKASGKS